MARKVSCLEVLRLNLINSLVHFIHISDDICSFSFNAPNQRHLKKWTIHSTLILPNSKSLEISLPKFQDFYNYKRYEFTPNLKGVAQKMGLLGPFDVLDAFGRKSKFWAPRTFKFCTKPVPIEFNNL